ncbi:hypothetical protein UFOVP190_130 [uncultured Caudovirales phage]|uniref:Uncharacterized protein n=1 Tax=uncultured Caudovirales phage TaxID=2100421 RepID=A0A6J7WGY6_9CAUD|nr:hypothetical protein UFOVP190_130 [uncultured Caudovirales phage]
MREYINLIIENEQPQVINALVNLLNFAKSGDATDPSVQDTVALLTNIEQTAEKIENQPVAKQAPISQQRKPRPDITPVDRQPRPDTRTDNTQQVDNTVTEVRTSKLDQLGSRLANNKSWPVLLQALRAVGMSDNDIITHAESLIHYGREEEFKLSLEWDKTLEAEASALADKVVRNGDIIHGAILANSAKDGQQTTLAEAKEEAGTAIKAKIVDILKGIFSKPAKTEKDRSKVEQLRKLTAQFMNKCRVGIIDFEDILTSSTNKIDDLVDSSDLVIYNFIKREAFNAVPGTTAGAWGPGEIGLSMLATPVTKGEVGDLRVKTSKGVIEVELKGMQSAKSGGRFNSNAVAKAKDAGREYKKHLNTFYSELDKIFKQGKQKLPPIATTFKVVSNAKTGATKLKKPETFDLEAINKVWNPKLIEPASKINPQATLELVKQFLAGMADSAVLDEGKRYAQKSIDEMINDPKIINFNNDGSFTLNWLGIQANICKILYSVYAGVDKKGVIMYFNTITSNYYIVKGPNDMKKQILSGKLSTGNSIIDFGSGQTPASPQVGIA